MNASLFRGDYCGFTTLALLQLCELAVGLQMLPLLKERESYGHDH